MTEKNSILVDSNVIIDVIRDDPQWASWSMAAMAAADTMLINPIIFAELCYQQTSAKEVEQLMKVIGLGYAEMPRESLFLASQAFRSCRSRGGTRTAPLSDFFIGAHAQVEGLTLLTWDRTRYETYFPSVALICP